MGGLAAFLAAMAGPLAKRVLVALGFGVVSYGAVSVALNAAIGAAKAAWGGMGGEVLSLVQLSGANQAMAIICGALTARIALSVMKRLTLLA